MYVYVLGRIKLVGVLDRIIYASTAGIGIQVT